jgi:hypothetical protein
MAQALGFFITVLYLPNFASSLGLMEIQGTTALAVLNGERVPFQATRLSVAIQPKLIHLYHFAPPFDDMQPPVHSPGLELAS